MTSSLARVEIRDERDFVTARQLARTLATKLGFDSHDQVRIAAAVSEVVRESLAQLGGGHVEYLLEDDPFASLVIRVSGQMGDHSTELLSSGSTALDGARRLMDLFAVEPATASSGPVIRMTKALPRRSSSLSNDEIRRIVAEMTSLSLSSPTDELLRQNRELIGALNDVRAREVELERVNRELEETNRGVLALYVELDERAVSLKRASELKTHFLANMSHELRTPLSSILSLARLLLDRVDGPLGVEQERQVSFILKAAHDLAEMVNDLLDLARIEAGRENIRPSHVDLVELFRSLRGMIRPLQAHNSVVSLIFDDPTGQPTLWTDEAKLAQILRNFLTNALKFTEQGEVRLRVESIAPNTVTFTVEDTGIGIDAEDLDLIFEEFAQIDGPLQRKLKGTGLGLPLTRKLAGLLGGHVEVKSQINKGSVFSATIPIRIPTEIRAAEAQENRDG